MVDAHANFAISSIATAPSPATTGTSLVVASGEGARFPAAPFNATVCPSGQLPTPANAEIVRVTAVASDTLTITRAQEGSTARTIVAGDLIFAAITAKTLTDIESDYAKAASVATYADRKMRTSGDYPISSSTYVDVDTGLDIVLTAKTGDFVEVGVSGMWNSENSFGTLDVASVVGAGDINSWADDGAASGNGVLAWLGNPLVLTPIGGSVMRKLVSGDISSGTVRLRLRGASSSGTAKTLNGNTTNHFVFWARNHG